ncbi:unnamed protein product [Bursaphelenchus okinawaensis]|uniref:Fibronectin type-III domain-containing protein n=1 Tax=Bursaphelenchus okinawaensis TaxID=465554 RepID=A0A811LJJ8_9BILA|nr:unnamed protein product [Bursaphelenchus okinawaensis]CAG9123628.1 unnamed protein product [Bursaphelenchus okinawaensis]
MGTNTLLVLILLLVSTEAFQVLPYVHIDYEHYYRLAQCQAQCVEKYGFVAIKRRLDGSSRSYFNVSSSNYNMCELGCSHARMAAKKAILSRSISDAFVDGQNFWHNAAESGQKSDKKQNQSPLSALKAFCAKPAATVPENGLMDSFEIMLTAVPKKLEFLAPAKILVQWKQRVPMSKGNFEETKWITAAIESDLTFKAEAIQPGVQYKFMATVIAANGKIGSGVVSEWLEVPALGTLPSAFGIPLTITPQYNSDDNVSAVISFKQPQADPTKHNRHHRHTLGSTCSYQLRYANVTKDIFVRNFEMDESEGILLTNLAFNTGYSIELVAVPTQSGSLDIGTGSDIGTHNGLGTNHNMGILTDMGVPSTGLTSQLAGTPQFYSNHPKSSHKADSSAENLKKSAYSDFKTISCTDIFGAGSLQCEPEPVKDLQVKVNIENGTATVTWRPSAEQRHVLLYELRYVPLSERNKCGIRETTLYLTAKTNTAEIPLSGAFRCEVEVELTNFDLRGRDAKTSTTFTYEPSPELTLMNTIDETKAKILRNLWLIILVPVVLICIMVLMVRFAHLGQRKLKQVAEKNREKFSQPVEV